MRIRFLSSNPHKIAEVKAILQPIGIEVIPVNSKIEEIQTKDVHSLVRDKCRKAFQIIGQPIFVEHTGLKVSAFNNFPDGLTQIFWDTIGPDSLTSIIGSQLDKGLTANTQIGFCDGKKIYQFDGEIRGTIPSEPRGDRSFQWDCVFIPDGHTETFAEMGMASKNKISMRKLALDKFAEYLESSHV